MTPLAAGRAAGWVLAHAPMFSPRWRFVDVDDDEFHNKKPPTPCLWQAPASTQKTKRKTRPAILRSARWRVSRFVGVGELLVRASAVLKSQGPENWSRGRPGASVAIYMSETADLGIPSCDLLI